MCFQTCSQLLASRPFPEAEAELAGYWPGRKQGHFSITLTLGKWKLLEPSPLGQVVVASSCAKGGSGWILGDISSQKEP